MIVILIPLMLRKHSFSQMVTFVGEIYIYIELRYQKIVREVDRWHLEGFSVLERREDMENT